MSDFGLAFFRIHEKKHYTIFYVAQSFQAIEDEAMVLMMKPNWEIQSAHQMVLQICFHLGFNDEMFEDTKRLFFSFAFKFQCYELLLL